MNQHHANWRIRSIESLAEKDALFKPLHFSAAVSLTLNDLDRVRDEALKFLEALTKIVGPSKEEEIAAITLDLFRL